MLELLFLLLPIAAAYGWYMGHRSAQQDKQKQSHQISRQYMTGLNLLLSDQSDKAVDHFIELLQVDNETIDTHLALGNLFGLVAKSTAQSEFTKISFLALA